MKARLARFAADDKAATTTEFGLVLAGVGLAIASIMVQVGPELVALLERVVARLSGG